MISNNSNVEAENSQEIRGVEVELVDCNENDKPNDEDVRNVKDINPSDNANDLGKSYKNNKDNIKDNVPQHHQQQDKPTLSTDHGDTSAVPSITRTKVTATTSVACRQGGKYQ